MVAHIIMEPTSLQGVVIRDMAGTDHAAVIDLIWHLNCFEDELTGDRATDYGAASGSLANDIARIQPMGGIQLVAENDMQVVGYICCAITQGGIFLKQDIRRHGYVHNVVVSPAAKRQGIGEALMRAAETFCREQGIRSLVLSHVVGNDGAARLYDKLGLAPHAIERTKRLD